MRPALVVAATLLLLAPTRGEEEARPPALPFEAFGPRTLAAARVRLAGITADRAEQALRAVFPPSYPKEMAQETITGARQTLAPFDSVIRPLLEAGLEHVFVLLDGPDSEKAFGNLEPRVAIPVRGTRARDQMEAVRTFAGKAGLSLKVVPGCLVLFKGDTVPSFGFLTLDEAAFMEAFAAMPDDDIVVVGVPPEKFRAALREQHRRILKKNEKDEDRHEAELVRGAAGLVEADWFCASARLGPDPALRFRVRMRNEQAATHLRAAVDGFCDFLKQDWKKRSVAEDGTQIYDPTLGHKMVDAARIETEGAHAVMNLTAARMRTFVEGFVAAAEWLAKGIAELLEDDNEDKEKKQ